MAGLARAWHGIEAPFARAGRGVVGVDEAAHSVFAAGNANYDKIFYCQRRDREAVAFLVFGRHDIPDHVSRLRIERDYVRIQRPEKNLVAQNGESAIHTTAARTNISWELTLIHPDRTPRAGIQGKRPVVLGRGVKNAVCDQRRSLELAGRSGLIYPLRHERARVRDVDGVERAEAAAGIVSGISQPILRFLRGIQQAVGCDLRGRRSREESGEKQKNRALPRSRKRLKSSATDS